MRAAAALALCAALLLGSACSRAPTSILLVTLDTLRRDHVTPYTERPLTPAIERLAAEGRRYDAAWTTMPTTAPAHASLFTGLHPYEHGVRRNGMRVRDAEAAARGLTARLHEHGYATGAFTTASVMGSPPLGLAGFDVADGPPRERREGAQAVDRAIHWLREQRDAQPVFLWVHLFDAHAPYGSEGEKRGAVPIDRSIYGWVDRARFVDPEVRAAMADRYARGVVQTDRAFASLWSAWRERVGPDGFVLVVGDHGEFLDEYLDAVGFAYGHGAVLDEAVLGIPLIVAGPGVERGVSDEPVSIRDVHTTLLAAAGLSDPTADAEGRRDLRIAASAIPDRVVSAERRQIDDRYWQSHGVANPPSAFVDARAVAVATRDHRLLLDPDGRPQPGSTPPAGLLAAGERRAAAGRGSATPGPARHEIDPDVRDALRGLGYAE